MVDRKAVYAAFSPSPLKAEQTDLYVDLDKVRGSSSVVARMAERIRLSDQPISQVLAGHKGTGKTTEMNLLKRSLETGSPRFFVVFVRSDEELDRNDVDFPDLLIAMIRQIAAQLRSAGIELQDGYLKSRFEWLKDQLGKQIDLESAELDAGFGKLGIALKSSPDARREIRGCLDPDAGNWLNAANDLISKAVLELQKKEFAGLVVLVDDLDKMVVRPLDGGHTTASHLFVNRAAQLTGFDCHTVYSMPLSLAYSHHKASIRSSFGGAVPVIPMVKISERPPQEKAWRPGVDCLRRMIQVRLDHVSASDKNVFKGGIKGAVVTKLIQLSGGQPSELMTLIREAIISGELPIQSAAVDRVRMEGRREYARILRREHEPILQSVRSTGVLPRDQTNETLISELLDSRAVLQYLNGDEWYGLNPMVDLHPPTPDQTKSETVDPRSSAGES